MATKAFLLAVVTVLVAVSACLCQELMGEFGNDPPCDASKLLAAGKIDLEKFKGLWYQKYVSFNYAGIQEYDGLELDVSYEKYSDDNITLTFAVTGVSNNASDCDEDFYWTCQLEDTGVCRNTPEFLAILAVDYSKQFGSFVAWTERLGPDGLRYAMVSLVVRDPYVFPDLYKAVGRAGLAEACDEGADNPLSDFYAVKLPYAQTPDCFTPKCTRFSCPDPQD